MGNNYQKASQEAAKRSKEKALTPEQKREAIKRINEMLKKGNIPSGSPIIK